MSTQEMSAVERLARELLDGVPGATFEVRVCSLMDAIRDAFAELSAPKSDSIFEKENPK